MEKIWQAWLDLMDKFAVLLFPGGSFRESLLELWFIFWGYGANVLGVFIVAFLLYAGYNAFIAAGAQELLYGVFTIGLLYLMALLLRLEFLLWILNLIIPTLVVVLAVILQSELRRIFVQIGRQFGIYHVQRSSYQAQEIIEEMLEACEILARMGRGGLIVFHRKNLLRHIINTGTELNAYPRKELVVSLFGYDTPLHDGALVLGHKRILAAGCILPIDPKEEVLLSTKYGTRHRAAVSLTRDTDAVVLIISEESRHVSLAFDGEMKNCNSVVQAHEILCELFIHEPNTASHGTRSVWFFSYLFHLRNAIYNKVKWIPKLQKKIKKR